MTPPKSKNLRPIKRRRLCLRVTTLVRVHGRALVIPSLTVGFRLCLQCFPHIRQSCSEASSRRFLSVLHRPTALYAIRRRYCSSSKHLSCMLLRLSQNLRNSKHFFRKIAFAYHIAFPTVAPYTAKSFSPSRPSAAFRGPSSKAPTAQTPIRCVYAAK